MKNTKTGELFCTPSHEALLDWRSTNISHLTKHLFTMIWSSLNWTYTKSLRPCLQIPGSFLKKQDFFPFALCVILWVGSGGLQAGPQAREAKWIAQRSGSPVFHTWHGGWLKQLIWNRTPQDSTFFSLFLLNSLSITLSLSFPCLCISLPQSLHLFLTRFRVGPFIPRTYAWFGFSAHDTGNA